MNKEDLTIFRAYDIRGIYGDDLSVYTMMEIGKSFGTYLKSKNLDYITVGGDIRASTTVLQLAFVSGVTSSGISCDIVSESPLGITLFNSFDKKYGASAFITASHLPPDWNGVKFYWGEGIGFSPEENVEIYQIFLKSDYFEEDVFKLGKIIYVEPYNAFVKYLKSKFNFTKKFNIAIDCGNGATSLVVPKLYHDLGFKVISLFDIPDPTFPNRSSEPTEQSLKQLSQLVMDNSVHFGAGFDGDGDRCVFTDELGNVLSADTFGIIAAKYLMKSRQNNRVIINMECSLAMETLLQELGADVSRIRVGHSFLSLEGKNLDAVFGVEASGHAIIPDIFLFDDALILPLVFAAALQEQDQPLSELSKQIILPIKIRFDLACPDKIKFGLMEQIVESIKKETGEINDIDGVSLVTEDGRILVRVSNTGPKIRVTIESPTQKGFDKLKQLHLLKIEKLIKEKQ